MTDKAEKITPRLKTKYTEEVHPALRKEFKHGNVMGASSRSSSIWVWARPPMTPR